MKPSGVLCIALVLLLVQYNALAQTTEFSIEENGPRNEVVGRVVESGGADFRWVVEPVKFNDHWQVHRLLTAFHNMVVHELSLVEPT